MARPRKGEPLKGEWRKCTACGNLKYKAPSQLGYKRVICSKECWRKLSFNFPCKVCATPVYVQPTTLKYRCRSTCSPACRRQLRKILAKERHERLGVSKHQIDRSARYSVEAIEWRKAVFERDDYTCQDCGVRGTYLEADHIKPWAFFPELRFELSNGRTLCRPCHNKTRIGYRAMRKIYAQEKK